MSFFQIESRIESQVVLGHGLGKMGGMEPRHFDVSSPFAELLLFFLFACCSLSFSFGESSTEDVKMQCQIQTDIRVILFIWRVHRLVVLPPEI